MASDSLMKWNATRRTELDQLLDAHRRFRIGRRVATEQITFAYLVAIAAQFQGFCRDLHTEAIVVLEGTLTPVLAQIVSTAFSRGRRLDQGNANAGTIAEDFGRIGMKDFWPDVARKGGAVRTRARLRRIEQMNMWRNAIAHSNFEQYLNQVDKLGGVLRPRLAEASACRVAVNALAAQISEAVAAHLARVVGTVPW